MDTNVWVYADFTGRRFVGIVVKDEGGIAEISDPILMSEIVRPPQAELQVAPLWHSFDVDNVYVKWTHKHPANQRQTTFYNDVMTQIRAARAGISLESKIPDNVINIVKNQ